MEHKHIVLNKDRNVTLDAYCQDVGGELTTPAIIARPAVLVLPGGGYVYCSDREADPVAVEFLRAGFQVFILRYTVKKTYSEWKWDMPMQDYEQAMSYIDEHLEELHTDKSRIAVCGFSAGGHLAAYAATNANRRPAAALLGYATLYGMTADILAPNAAYPTDLVDNKTCPCFIFAARDDGTVDIENSIEFQKALRLHNINFEAHIYSYGNHAFSCGERHTSGPNVCSRVHRWTQDAIDWLEEVWGELTLNGYTAPKFERTLNGNSDDYLSVKCTIEHLLKQCREAADIAKEPYDRMKAFLTVSQLAPELMLPLLAHGFKLCDLLKSLKYTNEQIAEIDSKLKQFPNNIK